MSLGFEGRDVLVVSPHFDDVPLSLGQSLTDGELARARHVRVRVVFGRTNWTNWLHPTRGRAPLVSTWRRGEELLAAARFGYTLRVQPLEEVILRTGSMDPTTFREPGVLDGHPLVDRVTAMIRLWSGWADILLLPAGLGGHEDHRIVATAGVRALRAGLGTIAFYEDRPYTAYMDDADIAAELAGLVPGFSLDVQEVSGPIQEKTQRTVQRIYRSQMNGYFADAQRRDVQGGRCERIWVP